MTKEFDGCSLLAVWNEGNFGEVDGLRNEDRVIHPLSGKRLEEGTFVFSDQEGSYWAVQYSTDFDGVPRFEASEECTRVERVTTYTWRTMPESRGVS